MVEEQILRQKLGNLNYKNYYFINKNKINTKNIYQNLMLELFH